MTGLAGYAQLAFGLLRCLYFSGRVQFRQRIKGPFALLDPENKKALRRGLFWKPANWILVASSRRQRLHRFFLAAFLALSSSLLFFSGGMEMAISTKPINITSVTAVVRGELNMMVVPMAFNTLILWVKRKFFNYRCYSNPSRQTFSTHPSRLTAPFRRFCGTFALLFPQPPFPIPPNE